MSDAIKGMNWQPWSLDDLSSHEEFHPHPASAKKDDAPPSAGVTPSFTEEDLAELRERVEKKAQQAGFNHGEQEGYNAGYQRGLEEGRKQGLEEIQQQQSPMVAQLQQMVTEFQQTLDSLDSVVPARLMQLALTAAKQVLGQAPVCDGTALLSQIQQFIQQEPMFSGKPQLRVHSSDLAQVEKHLGATLSKHGWSLLADNQLHPGGCKVSAEEGDLDASLATRWRELCRLAAPGEL
ncbi:flagellar assembly protein FliH [Brenneria tiliae]|uniref:flagellar assembly protein FliH n=1 Tax=Brenneria tiliae TaxID=2914984 RepID=UPI002014D7C9|nr:flagellar assembly protein FliH [Brenneria tiliae]MCL2899837.1 flagellar assembly protein FliH [Brenneria tiliae]MCL2904674.1 flagellar assembly protein FliH [Brenneria tiliae]